MSNQSTMEPEAQEQVAEVDHLVEARRCVQKALWHLFVSRHDGVPANLFAALDELRGRLAEVDAGRITSSPQVAPPHE